MKKGLLEGIWDFSTGGSFCPGGRLVSFKLHFEEQPDGSVVITEERYNEGSYHPHGEPRTVAKGEWDTINSKDLKYLEDRKAAGIGQAMTTRLKGEFVVLRRPVGR